MPIHLDYNDPRYAISAHNILQRHANNDPEANITSAIRDFLILTGLAKADEINEEFPPGDGSRRAVDLGALDTLIEVKRRIGTVGGMNPNPEYVQQLDDYLKASAPAGKGVRMGVLTDGKYWLLRWPGAGPVKTLAPYAFTLEDSRRWVLLYEWLRDEALVALEDIAPKQSSVEAHFGPLSPRYELDIAVLGDLYRQVENEETIKVKRRLWFDLLRAALGELAGTTEDLDDLFIRHTYLSMVIGMVVQASFGLDIRQIAASDPADLLQGRAFRAATGLKGIVESDFFAWPTEVGGSDLVTAIAGRVGKFDFTEAPADIAAVLYESVIPPEERRQLGEYYTPEWLARTMVEEVVTDPLRQRVLDPACGSGTFVVEAVKHFLAAAGSSTEFGHPKEVLDRLRDAVAGIDVHPVAVHLARAAWVLAARPAIEATVDAGIDASVSIPIYLGDALQLRFRTGDLFAAHQVTVQVEDEKNSSLVFPVSLVDRAEDFDSLMSDIAEYIEGGDDPALALDDNGIADPGERRTLEQTVDTLVMLHNEGRDHIWAYYTRNLVRPVALGRQKVDVIIGNPPWLNYNQTASTLRTELRRQSDQEYGIWAGGRYATHQDVAGLFYARCTDLYLRDGGVIGMVMPHSALQAGQHSKWRTGSWTSKTNFRTLAVDFGFKTAWDLEKLEPNDFFPIPACVVFARRTGEGAEATELAGAVEEWTGEPGLAAERSARITITDTSSAGVSPYAPLARNGTTIYPRGLFFVYETAPAANLQAGLTVTINPRRGAQDKEPWKSLDLTAITGQTVPRNHVFDVHLGETVVPYATLDPLKAALPLKRSDTSVPADPEGIGGVDPAGLEPGMRRRWRQISDLWEQNKQPHNRLDLVGRLDFHRGLSSQLLWQQDHEDRPVRLIYSGSGRPTAAVVDDHETIVDYTLFWIPCKSLREAQFLLGIINSLSLEEAVAPLMPKGQYGARHLQKHLWRLPIPEFDPDDPVHLAVAEAGEAATAGASQRLEQLREDRDRVTVTIARRELRKWLADSDEGRAVEDAVERLLSW